MIDDSPINIFSNFNDVAGVDGHIRQDFSRWTTSDSTGLLWR